MDDHVVVVFGAGPAKEWCELSHCPMYAHGPFSEAEAKQVAGELPGWMQPHVLRLKPPQGPSSE